jgi:hypothetical protein
VFDRTTFVTPVSGAIGQSYNGYSAPARLSLPRVTKGRVMKTKKVTERVAPAMKNAALDRLVAMIQQLPDAKLVSLQAEVDRMLQGRGKRGKRTHTPPT